MHVSVKMCRKCVERGLGGAGYDGPVYRGECTRNRDVWGVCRSESGCLQGVGMSAGCVMYKQRDMCGVERWDGDV